MTQRWWTDFDSILVRFLLARSFRNHRETINFPFSRSTIIIGYSAIHSEFKWDFSSQYWNCKILYITNIDIADTYECVTFDAVWMRSRCSKASFSSKLTVLTSFRVTKIAPIAIKSSTVKVPQQTPYAISYIPSAFSYNMLSTLRAGLRNARSTPFANTESLKLSIISITLWLRHTLLRTDRTIRQGLCACLHSV